MITWQHISNHLERLAGVLLPGGTVGSWHLDRQLSRFFVELCPAGLVAIKATCKPAMRNRVDYRFDARRA